MLNFRSVLTGVTLGASLLLTPPQAWAQHAHVDDFPGFSATEIAYYQLFLAGDDLAHEFRTGEVGEEIIRSRLTIVTETMRELIAQGTMVEADYVSLYLGELETMTTDSYIGPLDPECPGPPEMVGEPEGLDSCTPLELREFVSEDVGFLATIYYTIAALVHGHLEARGLNPPVQHGVSGNVNECARYQGLTGVLAYDYYRHPSFPDRVMYDQAPGKALAYHTSFRWVCWVAIPGQAQIERFRAFEAEYGREALRTSGDER